MTTTPETVGFALSTALEQFPTAVLLRAPTPLDPLPRLSERLGFQVLLKRDDLTGLALGGDKVRKLEYELGHARDQGADVIVTGGSMQSNHARLATAAARQCGMDCVVVLSRDVYAQLQGNLLIVYLLGAEVRVVDVVDHWDLQTHIDAVADELRGQGRRPHCVPVSGTTPRGCLGNVRAGIELAQQLREQHIQPDAVYTPLGTGGVLAGLLTGLRYEGVAAPLIGVSVNREAATCRRNLDQWWSALSSLLHLDPERPRGEVIVCDEFVGHKYGAPTSGSLDAIQLMAQTEGILLDPVYSGKMTAGFLAHARQHWWPSSSTVVLVHTGGVSALFAYHDVVRSHLLDRGVSLDALG